MGIVAPMVDAAGNQLYVLWCSQVQYTGISRARAEHLAEIDVAERFPGADRRRVKREIRKAMERMER